MIELKSTGDRSDEEMVVLFTLDDVEYKVPARPRVNLSLQYLTDARQFGEQLAQMMLLEKMLGPDGYEALSSWEDLTAEQLGEVADYAARLALGALEGSQGNDKSGSKKSRG